MVVRSDRREAWQARTAALDRARTMTGRACLPRIAAAVREVEVDVPAASTPPQLEP
jgi:hypothetical protein